MTRDVITAAPEAPLREIANLMGKHGIERVPIVQDNLVVGIVRELTCSRHWLVPRRCQAGRSPPV